MQTCRTVQNLRSSSTIISKPVRSIFISFLSYRTKRGPFCDFYITGCDTNIKIKSQLKYASCEEILLVVVKWYSRGVNRVQGWISLSIIVSTIVTMFGPVYNHFSNYDNFKIKPNKLLSSSDLRSIKMKHFQEIL